MSELGFLPAFPLAPNLVLLFGVLLVTGLLGGWAAARGFGVPRITGYVAIGMLLGPSGLNWISAPVLEEARIFADVALGLVLFELGRRLNVPWLVRERWLLATSVLESSAAFALVYGTLQALGVEPVHAGLAAAAGMSTSPAVLLVVARDLRAEGQVTERALNLSALNSALAFLCFTLLLSYAYLEQQASWVVAFAHPLYLIGGSLLLGYLVCLVVFRVAGWLGKRADAQFVLLVAAIATTIGLAHALKLSVLIALLAVGVLATNLDRRRVLAPIDFGPAAQLFFVILFVFSGAALPLHDLAPFWWMGLAFVLARFAGKFAIIVAMARPNRLAMLQALWLGVSQLPMSGLAIVLVASTALVHPDLGARMSAIVLSAVVLLELVGPVAAQIALRSVGEAAPEETAP